MYSTGYEPFYLMYGRMPRSPFSTTFPRPIDVSSAEDKEYLYDLVQGLQFAHEKARENMTIQKAKMKKQYYKNVYTEDSRWNRVWVYFPMVKVGDASKLTKKLAGPFIITEKVRPENLKAMSGHDLKPFKNMVHVDRLKSYVFWIMNLLRMNWMISC